MWQIDTKYSSQCSRACRDSSVDEAMEEATRPHAGDLLHTGWKKGRHAFLLPSTESVILGGQPQVRLDLHFLPFKGLRDAAGTCFEGAG